MASLSSAKAKSPNAKTATKKHKILHHKLATLPKLKTARQNLNNLSKDAQNLTNNAKLKEVKKVYKKLAKKARKKVENVEKIDKWQDK